MRILAIDPGTQTMGSAVFVLDLSTEQAGLRMARRDHVVKTPEAILAWFERSVEEAQIGRDGIPHGYQRSGGTGDIIAIERPGVHPFKTQTSATKLFELIGFLKGIAVARGFQIRMIDDPDVKQALTGRPNGSKAEAHWTLVNMGYALPVFGSRERCDYCDSNGSSIDPRHSPDAADAIGVGHVCAAQIIMERRAM